MSLLNKEYLFSFTTGGLLLRESLLVVDTYAQTNDWEDTLNVIVAENAFQTRTPSTLRKRFHEIRRRLGHLTSDQRDLLQCGTPDDQVAMLWLAVCKRYRIIREFAVEVVRDRFLAMQWTVESTDFDRFLEAKTAFEPSCRLTESTQKKVRRTAMQILREAGLLKSGKVQPQLFSKSVAKVIAADEPTLFRIFPISDEDFARLVG